MLGGQNVYQQNTTIPKLPPNQMPQNQFYGENAMVKNRESQYSTNPWTMYSWSNPSAIESWEGSGIAGQNIQGGGYSSGKTGKAYNADGSINREMTKGNKQAMGGMGQGGMGFGQGGMGFGQIPVGMTEIMKPISQMIQPSEYNEKVGAERPGFVSSLWEDNTLAQAGGQFGWVGGTIGAFADKIKNAFNYGNKLNQYNEAVGTYNIKEGIDKQNQFAGTDYTRTAKYGLEAPAQKTLVNVEPYEIGVIKGEDGKYKKVFETDEETPIHEYGGENKAVQPGTIIFPQPFLKDVKSAVDNEDTEKVEKLADIMLARSKKASQLNLPYSNQSATQLKLNELMQSKYGSKIPKYAMGGVTYSENNPYTPGFEQMYEGFSPVIGFEDPVMAQQGIKQMPLFNQNRFDGYAKGGEHTHEALHNQPMPLNPLQKFANGGIAGDPPPNFAQVKQDNTFFQQPPLPRFFNEEEIMAREKGAMELDSLQKEYAGNPYLWEEVKKLKQQSLNMDADIREADTKLHIAKQRKFGYPFLGGKSYFAYGGIAGPGDPPKKKVKSNLGGIDFPMIDYNQGESTTVVKPIIMPRTDTQPSTLTTDQQRALYNRTKESIGSSAPNVGNIQVPKQVSEGEKLFNQLKSPLTTIGGQLERNPLDYATDVVNPFAYLGLAKDAWDYASQGQFGDATFAATAAMPFFPMFKFGKAKTATKSFDELAEGVRTEIKGLEKSVKPYDEILETTDPKKLDEIAGITKSADDIKRADFEKKIMSSTDPDELQAISNQMKIDELSNKYFQGKGIPQFNPYIRGASMWRKSAGDHLSDINITYSNIAKENLLRENISPDKVFKIGSPLYETYYFYQSKIQRSKILNKLKIKKRKYYLLSVHREENIDDPNNFKKFLNLLLYFDKKNNYKVIVSTHPRTMKKIKKNNTNKFKNIIFHKPFSYFDYSNLQLNAKIVLSDSGSITEESNIMKFDAINLRSTNERQEGMEYGAVPMSHFVIKDIERLTKIFEKKVNKNEIILDYKCKNFSDIFLNILISYINYIKEYTWKKKI